ncbi:iron complex outermembrane receptor protein [Chryseobacterium defluvii]|uniref:Iron complex outermembrane receptor protein n=1 Tax=Chryseobacterium defluvii TaxID=160396 RepID=A0A840KEX6_9FLAO|nr:TonB-dependent receptor [Chryseobacterium defluvii]MBB4806093.1 iron complex outermembrane receptor protein [Chryseobacterium defluvii]
MDIKRSLVVLLSSYGCFLFGQEKTIDTVYIFDNQMNKAKLFHKVTTLSPQDIQKNYANLSEVLRFQSSLYIKENGRGMVSSPSFRGTAASHTAFVWNGININSQFLGQGDINNIALFGYDQLEVKAGGGSVVYGSSAIGGSIHLNNDLKFNQGTHATLYSESSSFETYNNFTKVSFSNDKFSVKVSGNHFISRNDYEVEEEDYINRNGRYFNTTFNIGVSYRIAPNQSISWQSQFYDSSQHYPIFVENGNKTKYETQSTRSLISWDVSKSKLSNSLKAAYTEENFQYFGDLNAPKTSGATGKNYIFKDDFNYFITSNLNLNVISEFQVNKGEGYGSGIDKINRNTGSIAGLLRYFATKDLRFEAGIKKDFVEGFDSPVLYSFSGKWNALKWYSIAFNTSRNFRFPTFNDLYWQPGGNPDLKPETSVQADMDHEFTFGDFKLTLSPYYMNISDYIGWLPTQYGYWAAFNTHKTESYGLESQLTFFKQFNKHNVRLNAGYTFARSVNKETGKQMMYVPLHKVYGNLDYQYQFLNVYVQGIFNGLTYTTTDEKRADALDPYFVLNAGISATVLKKFTLGIRVNNITDAIYKTVAYYPLPKRNYGIYGTINF